MPFNNLDSTAAQIARMTPQQRQQFAQMHKTDPIMMSLVSFVQNQDEAFRAAQMAKMTGQEKPKVVDQVIASINPPPPQATPQEMPSQGMPPQGAPQAAQQLPENTGIAALPAPNMQQMADGGITGYQDDLYVPDDSDARMGNGGYNFPQGEAVIRMADGTPPEMFYSPEESLSTYTQAEPTSREEQIYKEAEEYRQRYGQKPTKQISSAQKPARFDTSIENLESIVAKINRLPDVDRIPAMAQLRRDVGPQAMDALSIGAINTAPSYGAMPSGESPEAVYERMSAKKGVDPYAAQRQGIVDLTSKLSSERQAQEEKDIAERGEAFKGAEERVSKREQGLSKIQDRETGLALLAAGAAMMSTPGGLARALGKGVQVGAAQYGEGMAKIDAAKQKIDDARDKMEEYRRAEKMMTAKQRAEAKKEADQLTILGQKYLLEGVVTAGGDVKDMAKFFANLAGQKDIAATKGYFDVAQSQTTGYPGIARDIARLTAEGKPDEAKKLEATFKNITGTLGKEETAETKAMQTPGWKLLNIQLASETDPKKRNALLQQMQDLVRDQAKQDQFAGFKVLPPQR